METRGLARNLVNGLVVCVLRPVFPKLFGEGYRWVSGSFRFGFERHTRLGWGFVPFAAIARLASGNDVFPGVGSALGARDNVVEGQVLGAAAVLAGMAVSLEYVTPVDWRYFPHAVGAPLQQPNVFGDLQV